MGVVVRQGLKSSAVQYSGVAFGVVAILFIYPQARATYGVVQVIIAAAQLLVPVAMLGSYALAVRYYPAFREPDAGRQGLLTLLFGVLAVGMLLVGALWPLLDDLIVDHLFARADPAGRRFLHLILPMVALVAAGRLVANYTTNFRRIVVPTILEQFSFKLTLPVLVVLHVVGLLSVAGVVYGTLAHYVLVVLGLVAYLASLGQLRLPRVSPAIWARRREMAGFAGYSLASHIGGNFAFQIDIVLVSAFLGFEAAGQYSILRFMAEVIAKPLADLRSVTAPLISEAWTRGDLAYLQQTYRKSSDNLLLISGYVFAGITVCFPALTRVAAHGDALAAGFATFVLLGLARLVDAGTSVNDSLIIYSPRYRFNLVALALLAAVSLSLNVWLIPRLGLVGAGVSMLVAFGLYNGAKVLFAGVAFGLWPFGKTTFEVGCALVVATALAWAVPLPPVWWLEIAVRGGVLSAVLGAYVWWRPPSPELRGLMSNALGRLRLAR